MADNATRKISEHAARLREQMAGARMRCAALHELDLEDRQLPCAECRQRGAELYPLDRNSPSIRTP